jgi:hypothetical protein
LLAATLHSSEQFLYPPYLQQSTMPAGGKPSLTVLNKD